MANQSCLPFQSIILGFWTFFSSCHKEHQPRLSSEFRGLCSAHLTPRHPEEEQDGQIDRIDYHTGHKANSDCVDTGRDQTGHRPHAEVRRKRMSKLEKSRRKSGRSSKPHKTYL